LTVLSGQIDSLQRSVGELKVMFYINTTITVVFMLFLIFVIWFVFYGAPAVGKRYS
jgi:hypothetical protein